MSVGRYRFDRTQFAFTSLILQSALWQVHSFFQCKFSAEYAVVLPLSVQLTYYPDIHQERWNASVTTANRENDTWTSYLLNKCHALLLYRQKYYMCNNILYNVIHNTIVSIVHSFMFLVGVCRSFTAQVAWPCAITGWSRSCWCSAGVNHSCSWSRLLCSAGHCFQCFYHTSMSIPLCDHHTQFVTFWNSCSFSINDIGFSSVMDTISVVWSTSCQIVF